MFSRRVMSCLLLLLLPVVAQATQVIATLDRNNVELGQTVTLNVRVQGGDSGISMPDLQALNQDFDVLGTSQNTSVSVVNGSATSSLTFGIALRPKHVGALIVPALSVAGAQTTPQPVQVSPPDPSAASSGRDVFMEAVVDPQHAYVGQQLSYVVRLYYAVSISNGALNEPAVDGMEVSRVGKDVNFDAERAGRQYHVLERRYALTPQHAGHIELPAANFEGEAIDRNDPDSFFGSSTPVSASAAPVSVDVKAPPADWGKSTWLPARELSLTLDGLPGAKDQVRVGQPLNLTMSLQATGLPFEALPELNLPPLEGAKAYPDKAVNATRQDGQWLLGKRQQSFAIVPERAGTLTIPATTLKWWNVKTDRLETATIDSHRVTVLPAIGSSVQPPVPAAATSAGDVAQAMASGVPPWRWIALGSLGLWLLSMLAWWLWRRSSAPPAQPAASKRASAAQCQSAFLVAAAGNDSAAQARTLLAWARTERPTIHHLGALSDALGDPSQHEAIDTLQRHRYASVTTHDAAGSLATAFKRGFVWRAAEPGQEEADLPPLYPFKLR